MRPPDENQHGSTRPNLLSDGRRRFAGDDNILERLERDSARQASGNRSRAAWYAASASLVLLLIIVVGWTAYENASTVQVLPMTRAPANGSAALAAESTADDRSAPPQGAPVTVVARDGPDASLAASAPAKSAQGSAAQGAPAAAAQPASAGAMNTPSAAPAQPHGTGPAPAAAPSPVRDSAIASLPPLVLLHGGSANTRAAPAVRASAPIATPSAGQSVARAPAPAATARARAADRDSAAAQQVSPSRAAPRTAAPTRTRKVAPGNVSTEAQVDRDVALLSAIIIHDSSHADEKARLEAAPACVRPGDKKCASRPSGSLQLEN